MKAGRTILVLFLVAAILGTALVLVMPRDIDLHLAQTEPSDVPEEETVVSLADCGIIEDEEFGAVYIDTSIEDFNALGFEYGDSVDVVFSNGYELRDLPYYNGYYSRTDEPLLVGYPGSKHVKAAITNGDGLWEVAGLKDSDTVTVTLVEKGKYQEIQNARDVHYVDDRDAFENDAVFANFRGVEAGDIKADRLFRSASPCDNKHNRATYVDALMGEAGVALILDLADSEEMLAEYPEAEGFDCPNFLKLYEAKKVVAVGLKMNFGSEEFRDKLGEALITMSEQPGPYLVHCTEGKDRTGFVCMLLEALCGASYDEIVEDYMITYDNYYGITRTSDPDRYRVIVAEVLDPMLQAMLGDDGADLATADLKSAAEAYLKDAGMTDDQITALRNRLTA